MRVYEYGMIRKCLLDLPDGLYETPQYILSHLNSFDIVNDVFHSQLPYYKILTLFAIYLCYVLFA